MGIFKQVYVTVTPKERKNSTQRVVVTVKHPHRHLEHRYGSQKIFTFNRLMIFVFHNEIKKDAMSSHAITYYI